MNNPACLLTGSILLANVEKQLAFGARLGICLDYRGLVFLSGELGAGKTTLVRGLLNGLGYQNNVKSPTYTLLERYQIAERLIYHSDLYRLNDIEELEFIGIREWLSEADLFLIEWPERALAFLPIPDLAVQLTWYKDQRQATLVAYSQHGVEAINRWQQFELSL